MSPSANGSKELDQNQKLKRQYRHEHKRDPRRSLLHKLKTRSDDSTSKPTRVPLPPDNENEDASLSPSILSRKAVWTSRSDNRAPGTAVAVSPSENSSTQGTPMKRTANSSIDALEQQYQEKVTIGNTTTTTATTAEVDTTDLQNVDLGYSNPSSLQQQDANLIPSSNDTTVKAYVVDDESLTRQVMARVRNEIFLNIVSAEPVVVPTPDDSVTELEDGQQAEQPQKGQQRKNRRCCRVTIVLVSLVVLAIVLAVAMSLLFVKKAPPVVTVNYCGNGYIGNGVCENGSCCSKHGYCDWGIDFCGDNDYCGNGRLGNKICTNSTECCSPDGYCGSGESFCAVPCGNGFNGTGICENAGECCSSFGWCGKGPDYCSWY